jgi:hypothetical protein
MCSKRFPLVFAFRTEAYAKILCGLPNTKSPGCIPELYDDVVCFQEQRLKMMDNTPAVGRCQSVSIVAARQASLRAFENIGLRCRMAMFRH